MNSPDSPTMTTQPPRTLFDKLWDAHVVSEQNGETLLYVDRHLLHDGSFHAFDALKAEIAELKAELAKK